MEKMLRNRAVILMSLILVFGIWMGGGESIYAAENANPGKNTTPNGVHLNWARNDVYHTMAISWWTIVKTDEGNKVLYDTVPHQGAFQDYKYTATGSQHQISTSRSTWEAWYHDVELTGLEPGVTYYFICGGPSGWSKEHSFRTISLNQNVKFVFGGDSRSSGSDEMEGPLYPKARIAVSKGAAKEEPDFVVFAGDMVTQGYVEDQWHAWFDDVVGNLVTEDGRMIPLVPEIGNHDLASLASLKPPKYADMSDYDYYRGLFALPGNELWYTLDFPNIRLIVLCTAGGTGFSSGPKSSGGRVEDEAKAQIQYLTNQLSTATQKWVLTSQHYSITGGYGLKPGDNGWGLIYHWVPLFESYGMPLNLGAHSHMFVRTWPMSNFSLPEGFVDWDYALPPTNPTSLWPAGGPNYQLKSCSNEGVTYLINGNWGATTEWMEKGSRIRIYDWFASAYSRPSYTLLEATDAGLHVVTKDVRDEGLGYDLPHVMDDFTLHFCTGSFPAAEYNVAF